MSLFTSRPANRKGQKRIRMAEDREVLREIWEARLPVSFQLAQDEVVTLNVPEPFYLMVPRLLYFPLVTDKVRKHFIQYVSPEASGREIWLSDGNGQPIKWNYPIGLWFDLFAEGALPWTVTVHFDGYPEDKIMRCSCKETVRSQFMSYLKEADALKHKGQVMNCMQEKDHNQLWQGFQNDKFDQFWSVNKKLMESVVGEGFRHIPIKCYTPEKLAIQRIVKPIDDTTGTWTTLHDALLEFFPTIDFSTVRVIIHGVEPPLGTPVQWLSEHMSYPDNFLHLSILPSAPRFSYFSTPSLSSPSTESGSRVSPNSSS
ncbi:Autophagy protein 5 [Orchesella cincta]|uniref:Autophagy protein 5 n=1 Tax=Orchesella cincta TaxID=48709 RepID=A0A1D2MV77_ORCCI|nr:Autophagy protein 5 [Orchesella cincta]